MGWVIGAVINVIGSVLINLGTNVIKLGHNQTASAAPLEPPPITKHPKQWFVFPGKKWFLLGMIFFGVGNVLNFASFGFAAQSLLAALGNVQFLTNMVFARFLNKEHITRRVMGAMALVITGCILLVSFGNHESPVLTAHDLMALYGETPYIVYLCVMGVAVVAAYLIYRRGKAAIGGLKVQRAIPRPWSRWLPICYALFSGLLGTQSVLYGKTLSMLLRTTAGGDSQLGSWYTWLALVLFVFFAAFWLTRYSKALRLFPVSVMMPTLQIVWVLFSIVSGSLYYQEYKTLDALSGSMFGVGIAVMLAGIFFLTGGKGPQQPDLPKDIELEEQLPAPSNGSVDAKPHSAKLLGAAAGSRSDSARRQPGRAMQDSAAEEVAPALVPAAAAVRGRGGHARQASDDPGAQLFAGPSSSGGAWTGGAAEATGAEEEEDVLEAGRRAMSSPAEMEAVPGRMGSFGVEPTSPSRGRMGRASLLLEEHDMNANLKQFALGFAGLDYLNPLSPAFTAFSMPLVPAVGPARCLSAGAPAEAPSPAAAGRGPAAVPGQRAGQDTSQTVSYATRRNVEAARGRHRAQRSHSTGELTTIVVQALALDGGGPGTAPGQARVAGGAADPPPLPHPAGVPVVGSPGVAELGGVAQEPPSTTASEQPAPLLPRTLEAALEGAADVGVNVSQPARVDAPPKD